MLNTLGQGKILHRRRHDFADGGNRSLALPQLLTPEEVASYLGVSAYTVRLRLKSGELRGRKHGARWLIRVVDLVAYVEPNNVISNCQSFEA